MAVVIQATSWRIVWNSSYCYSGPCMFSGLCDECIKLIIGLCQYSLAPPGLKSLLSQPSEVFYFTHNLAYNELLV